VARLRSNGTVPEAEWLVLTLNPEEARTERSLTVQVVPVWCWMH